MVIDRVDQAEDSSTNDTEARNGCTTSIPLLQSNMSYLNLQNLDIQGAPSMKQRKISDFIADMV